MKQERKIKFLALSKNTDINRIIPIVGRLDLENFGINSELYSKLSKEIDVIFHCGAEVNYILPYEQLYGSHVIGTKNVIRFASLNKLKETHYISSTIVFGWPLYTSHPVRGDTMEGDVNNNLTFGYQQAKFVSENLMRNATKKGPKVKIYRLPFCISSTQDQIFNESDVIIKFMKFVLKHRKVSYGNYIINLIPVDYAVDNIYSLALMKYIHYGTYHIISNNNENLINIMQALSKKLFVELEPVGVNEFVEYINKNCSRDDELYPLIPFINENYKYLSRIENKIYGSTNTKLAFEKNYQFKYKELHVIDSIDLLYKYFRLLNYSK